MEPHPNFSVVSKGGMPVEADNPEKLFSLEIESWCYGLARLPDPLSPELIYALIKEMSGSFLTAVRNHYAFDLVALARSLYEISEGIINEKELTFYILAHLPNPSMLDAECLATFKQIVSKANNMYPDVVQKFENRMKGQGVKSSG